MTQEMAMDFFGGFVAGVAGTAVGYPLDTLKVMMQVETQHKSTFGCIKNIIARDSIYGLYRGMSSPLGGVALVNATVFGVQGAVNRRFEDPNSLVSHGAAGFTAGIAQSIFCGPIELAKTRLQLGYVGSGIKGPIACMKDMVRREGPRSIFRGTGITMARDGPAFSLYFVTFEYLTKNSDGSVVSLPRMVLAGGLAGCASWLATFPIDALKSRLQADGVAGSNKYKGAFDCLKKSLKSEGPGFMARGLSATLLRAFPSNAVTLTVAYYISKPDLFEKKAASSLKKPTKRCDLHYAAHAYKSLLFASSFSEVICSNDISELHEDFYNLKRMNGVCCRCFLSIPRLLRLVKDVDVVS